MLSTASFETAAPPPPIADNAGNQPGSASASSRARHAAKLNGNSSVVPNASDSQPDVSSGFMGALHAASGKQDAESEPKDKKREPKDGNTQNQNAADTTQPQVQPADPKPFLLAQLGFGLPTRQEATVQASPEATTSGKTGPGALSKSTDRLPKAAIDPVSSNDTQVAQIPSVVPLPPSTPVNSDSGDKNGPAVATAASVEPGTSPDPAELQGADKAIKDPAVAEKPTGSLAFAMRLGADNATGESPAIAPVSGGASLGQSGGHNSAAGFSLAEPKAGSDRASSSGEGTNQNFQSAYSQAALHSMNSDAPATEKPTAATQAELDPAPESSTNQPLKNLNLQLTGENNQRVDVRLSDRGGALQVSVRSADLNLNQALQAKMPELTSRLEAQHMSAQVWTPSLEQSTKSGTNANGSGNQGQNPGENESGSRSSNQPGNQHGYQGNGQKNQKQPDWLDELD